MFQKEQLMKDVIGKLTEVERYVNICVGGGMTDANKTAEDFYCGFLNILFSGNPQFGWENETVKLANANYTTQNHPAIDLADTVHRLAVQVTSTNKRDKIVSTLEKFYEYRQNRLFDRLIVLIIGEKLDYRKKFNIKHGLTLDIWGSKELGAEIQKLGQEKLEALNGYLDGALIRYAPAPAPAPVVKKLDLTPPDSLGEDFQGRESELEQLGQRRGNKEPIFISGLGGMGKTELAVRFAQSQGKAHFVRFTESFYRTVSGPIAQGIEGLKLVDPYGKARPEAELYDEAMAVLKACGRDELLIIDNVDREDGSFDDLADDTYKALRAMDMQLLITTRFPVTGAVEVERLGIEELRSIMARHIDIPVAEMDALIEAVNGHTLTVDLIARTMDESFDEVDTNTILGALRGALDQPDYPEVGTDRNRDREQKRIDAHLTALFNVIRRPEEERRVLACATLLPEGGMETKIVSRCVEDKNALKNLCKRGWLRRDDRRITIHPVIRAVARKELTPGDRDCGPFLKALWGQFDKKDFNTQRYTQMAEVFSTATARLEDGEGDWADHGREILLELGKPKEAMALCEKVLAIRQNAPEPDRAKIATALNDMGHLYRDLGDYHKCFDYVWQAMEIRQEVLSEDDPDLAMSYNNVAVAYGHLGKYREAMDYDLKSLELRQRILPGDHPDLALSYDNVGGIYHALGDYAKDLEYSEKALKIRQRILPTDHPDLAQSYDGVGVTYHEMGDYQTALKYAEQAMEIRRRIRPADHPDLAQSYDSVGATYHEMGDYQTALTYQEQAMEIRRRSLPADHPDLARSYDSVGVTYHDLRDYQTALTYKKQALEIRRRILPADHPHLARSYNSVGATYSVLGNYEKALEYAVQALKIRRQSLPADHPDLGDSYASVGITYANLKQYETAIAHLEQALLIMSVHHPDYQTVKKALAHCKQKLFRPEWMSQIQ